MKLLTTFNKVPWKAVVGINFMFLILGGIGLATKYSQEPTSTSSKAAYPEPAEGHPLPTPNYPAAAPIVTAIDLPFAKPGDAIRIHGQHFGDYQWESTVSLHTPGVKNSNTPGVITWSDSTINMSLPSSVSSGVYMLTLSVNNHATTTAISIYNPATSPEIGLSEENGTYTLWINKAAPGSQLTFIVNNKKQTATIASTNQTLLVASTIPTLDPMSISLTQNGQLIPYFIDPLSLLLSQ